MTWVEDALFLLGLAMLGVGLGYKFDWETALIVCGALLVALPIVSAIRVPRSDPD